MAAAGIPYPIEYPVHVEAPAPQVHVDVVVDAPLQVDVAPDATNIVVKEKKTRAKKSAPTPSTNSGENVVLEKKSYKPRQKKNVASPAPQV